MSSSSTKTGAAAARVIGWVVLLVGLVTALVVGGFFLWLFPAGPLGWILGAVLALASLGVGSTLVLGGRKLGTAALQTEAEERHRALVAAATGRGGRLSAAEAGQVLAIPPSEADAFLTQMAKTRPDDVVLDLDAEGALLYRFPAAEGGRVRVDASTPAMTTSVDDAADEERPSPRRAAR